MRISQREHDVLTLTARGLTEREIGEELDLSVRTVQSYLSSVVYKLNARNRVNAVVIYLQKNPHWEI